MASADALRSACSAKTRSSRMPTPPRFFQIKFRIKNKGLPMQQAVVQATDSKAARVIFEQQNPGCEISSVQEVKR